MNLEADVVWRACIDDRGRLSKARRASATEVRDAKGHLVAYLVRTMGGDLWVRRDPWVERDTSFGWEVGWTDDGIQRAECGSCQRSWLLDPRKVDHGRRTMRPTDLKPDSPSDAEHPDDSTAFD
ncbi:hypothetical protein [Nocardioides aquiterrae]|uniref:Uncharacterized protein n=1 Tax=Nocardioides aquiterrae TaxID=203799 RepID=A0ABN1UM46_9ACTN